jgi:hypothetical protein
MIVPHRIRGESFQSDCTLAETGIMDRWLDCSSLDLSGRSCPQLGQDRRPCRSIPLNTEQRLDRNEPTGIAAAYVTRSLQLFGQVVHDDDAVSRDGGRPWPDRPRREV